ncbi:MAG: hypothetical protein JWM05_1924 [Acidimicrobiales bacterium]|nr:hypothetical protein [Acidimicrobiales bacterium]
MVIAERLGAQQLSGPRARSPEELVTRLLAVQAQDPRGARLSVRSRSSGLAAVDVDAALTARRSAVVSWLMRGTLHLVAAEDYWWLHPLTTPQLRTGSTRRLAQEGVSPEQASRGVAIVSDAVRSRGPQTRPQLKAILDQAGVPTAGQALVHVLLAASLDGDLVRGPMVGREQAFVSARAWLGPPPAPIEPEEALGRLAHRYLVGHGPADARDLSKWAGISLGDARRGLRAVEDQLVTRTDGLVDLAERGDAPPLPPPRLLGPFDPLLLGWTSRDPFVGEHRGVATSNGLFRPVALVDGRVVATWGLAAGTVSVTLLEDVRPAARAALRDEAADVLRFLALPERPAAGL